MTTIIKKDERGYSWIVPSTFEDKETMEHIFKAMNLRYRINKNGDFIASKKSLRIAEKNN